MWQGELAKAGRFVVRSFGLRWLGHWPDGLERGRCRAV